MNSTDSTTHGVAVCSFLQHLFVFWKSNDPSNSILFSASPDGRLFPPGKRITPNDATQAAPACCVFNDQIFVFWKANDPSNSIFFSASPSGQDGTWSPGQKINAIDSTPESLAACVFQSRLFLFWKGNDSSAIFFSSSSTGLPGSWPPGQKINHTDLTPQGLAACVLTQISPQLYLFWKADDSDAIFFAASDTAAPSSWTGKRINSIDLTPHPLAACLRCNQIYLFWQADDPSNSIYFASYNDATNNTSWPPGRKINDVDHTPASPAACLFAGQFHVFWKADDPSNRILHSVLG